ncbi:hypothetical protein Pme01_18200 [Planosporangium mesophilum]|uniref:Uncharacterized protein n=1 Tax=Planosporangium mesophilum TaxID=689768 RepID=A0A8J3T9B0_9ACTN|nr:hypothetical protein Pme01_18200 [Planosporangium mesophilum]
MTAIGVAAGAGAAQWGLAYGLSVVAWQPVRAGIGEGLWSSGLAWVLWIGATSTVLGAVCAARLGTRAAAAGQVAHGPGFVLRTVMALAAAIGALVTVPLVMLPARAAQRADTFQPEVTAGAYAVIGVVVGLVVAVVAVNVRVIAANIMATTAWVWVLVAVSVVDAVRAGRTVGTAQLAAWQFTDRGWFRDTVYLPGALLMLGGALLIGVVSALPADRRTDNRVGIAISGTFGPLLAAAAYFLTAPRPAAWAEQLSAYLFAPYAVIGGLAGSVLVAVLGPLRPRRRPAVDSPAPAPVDATADEPELTEWTATLSGRSEPTPASSSQEPQALQRPAAAPAADETTVEITPAATGRATATRPTATEPTATEPEVPKPRKRRGSGAR